MKTTWIRAFSVSLLIAAMLGTTAAPASAGLIVLGYANFDGLAPGGVCATQGTPFTVSGWDIESTTGSVEFCPGNLHTFQPPGASHLEAPDGGTTTLQQDLPTTPIYTYIVSYTVDAAGATITTQVTADGVTTPCVSDTSQGPLTCDVPFQPTATTTSFTVTVTNGLATNIEFDDLHVWVAA